jgi:chromosome segregation protein
MRLTKLELNGFKSFAAQNGNSALAAGHRHIGPNGSEKAIFRTPFAGCWASRAQKPCAAPNGGPSLFYGTLLRKALAYSEVTLKFDNFDGRSK